jgi:glucose/arabinose dehydrogenase
MRQIHATKSRLGLERLEDRATPATLPTGFTESAIAEGLVNATAMEMAPNGDLWVLEQGGAVKRFRPGITTADTVGTVANLGLRTEGERGLLGIAFHPDYTTNKLVFLYYTTSDAPNPHNRVSRFQVNDSNASNYTFVDNPANPAIYDEIVILDLDPLSGATNHNGGAIHFGPDGKLYIAVGDNANTANAQSLSTRHGKILRINPNGTIPADNPTAFAGVSGTTSGVNRAVWALGLRNPFTFTFDPASGGMFINDVGQGTWEEVNVGGAGRNYGWPATEGDFDPAAFPAFTRPRYTYSHGGGTFQGFAITGGAFYNPTTNQFPASYAGDYFFADYVNGWINVINADGTGQRRFATGAGGVVDLKVTDDGSLLYLSRANSRVFEVTFTGNQAPGITDQPDSATVTAGLNATFSVAASGTAPLSYQWQMLNGSTWGNLSNGSGVSGATTATLTLAAVDMADAGQYRVVVTNAFGSATSNPATLTVTANQPPSLTLFVTSGLTGGRFVAGQAISFRSAATDPEDGGLLASAFTWKVEYITSIESGNPAIRPFVPEVNGRRKGTFTPAVTGPYTLTDVAYRITVRVRDSLGLTTTETLDILPHIANITLQTTPSGLGLTLDGQPVSGGTTVESVVGFRRVLGAPVTQPAGGFTQTFRLWSDGGAATHAIRTPAADTTYTARYDFVARVNFQPAGSPIPPNYLADSGAVFANRGNGFVYGWDGDISNTARDRNSPRSPDQRFDTFVQTQRAVNPDAVWEIAVPDGTYRVRVVAGDPDVALGVYRIDAEGVRVVAGMPTSAEPWVDGTGEVVVTDGRLTLRNAPSARDTRLAFVVIERIGPA